MHWFGSTTRVQAPELREGLERGANRIDCNFGLAIEWGATWASELERKERALCLRSDINTVVRFTTFQTESLPRQAWTVGHKKSRPDRKSPQDVDKGQANWL